MYHLIYLHNNNAMSCLLLLGLWPGYGVHARPLGLHSFLDSLSATPRSDVEMADSVQHHVLVDMHTRTFDGWNTLERIIHLDDHFLAFSYMTDTRRSTRM